jgi:hypothetical protein
MRSEEVLNSVSYQGLVKTTMKYYKKKTKIASTGKDVEKL